MNQALSLKTQFLSAEEFLSLENAADTRYELVDGVLVKMPPESDENNDIAKRLLFELAKYFSVSLIAYKDTEIQVTGRRAGFRIPDLLVHSEGSKAALAGKNRATLTLDMPPPDLVIEVVSPGKVNRDRDYRYKHTEYAARQIPEYWIIDPEERKVTVCQWIDGKYEDAVYAQNEAIQSALIAELALTVDAIFA